MNSDQNLPKVKAATLNQVATLAGVHPVTASRALHGDERVALATREKIQRIAFEIHYTPSSAARALVTGRTETIAVATGSISEHYYAQVFHAMEAELTASNYKMLVLRSRDLEHDLLTIVNTNAVDGVIAIDAFPTITDLVRSQNTRILPCVYAGDANRAWDELSSAVDTVKVNLEPAVTEAMQMMLQSGCTRIAYLATAHTMISKNEVRSRVYQAQMEAAGLPLEIINMNIKFPTSKHQVVREYCRNYFQQHGCPQGLLCQNDEVAIAAYRALRDLGKRTPEDTRIVGCDGVDYMDFFDPPLSTIVQPAKEMCAMAWQFLQRRISDPFMPHQRAMLTATLRTRRSLDPSLPSDA